MKVIPKLRDTTLQIIKISEKTLEKTKKINGFFTELANFSLFLASTIKETFSRDFEFKEFLRQCFQIGYKSLPLISVTGIIMGLVLTIQSRPALVSFGAVSMLPGNGSYIAHQGNGTGYNGIDMRRKNRFWYGSRIRFYESNRTN